MEEYTKLSALTWPKSAYNWSDVHGNVPYATLVLLPVLATHVSTL
jgi:hypothetical protein